MSDPKLITARRKYGAAAIVVYLQLLVMAYRDKGYYLAYGDSDRDGVIWSIKSEVLSGRRPVPAGHYHLAQNPGALLFCDCRTNQSGGKVGIVASDRAGNAGDQLSQCFAAKIHFPRGKPQFHKRETPVSL